MKREKGIKDKCPQFQNKLQVGKEMEWKSTGTIRVTGQNTA